VTQPDGSSEPVTVDASALFTLAVDNGAWGDAVVAAIRGRPIFVPTLAEYEVANVIRRHQNANKLTASQADEALTRFRRVPLRTVAFQELIDRAWELRDNVTVLDAVYVALAERLSCDLITRDARVASAPRIRCPVVVLTV
jgi:predicted nucleic acid-binding protein